MPFRYGPNGEIVKLDPNTGSPLARSTISQGPETLEQGPTKFEEFLNKVGNSLPTIGAVATPTIAGWGSGGLSVPASAGLSAAGYSLGNSGQRLLQIFTDALYHPEKIEQYGELGNEAKFVGSNLAGSAATGVTNLALGSIMNPLANKIFGPAGKVPLTRKGNIPILPNTLRLNAKDVRKETGQLLRDTILRNKDIPISTQPEVDILNKMLDEARTGRDPESARFINKIMNKFIDTRIPLANEPVPTNLEEANAIADFIGRRTKFTPTSGYEDYTNSIRKQIGGKLSTDVMDALINAGERNAPDIWKKYGALTKIVGNLKHPVKNFFYGPILSSLMATTGVPYPVASAVGAGVTTTQMPWTRLLGQQILGRVPAGIQQAGTLGTATLMERLLGQNR